MNFTNFTHDLDDDGILTVVWDSPEKSMNVIDLSVLADMEALVEALETDDAVKGAVITSRKETFCAGADLNMMQGLLKTFQTEHHKDEQAALKALFNGSRQMSLLLRRMETCDKPVVAAINGTALGGGFEITLACHYRVAAENDKTVLGLPEVKVGLLPGAGGTQRLPRMMPAADALQLIMQGRNLRLSRAKSLKVVDEIVPKHRLVDAAKKWIRDGGKGKQPWDEDRFRLPGGMVWSPAGMQVFPAANAIYRRETMDNYPGARAILSAVFEGLQMPMDLGLEIESRYFANVLQTTEAGAMVRSLFVSMQELNKLARRPADVKPSKIKKVGVVGAGFMGAGVAYVTAKAGIKVVLLDRDVEAAEKGKAYSDQIVSKAISRGRAKPEDKEKLLSLIQTTDDYADLDGCDLVIEAVFEDTGIKADVTQKAEAVIKPSAVFGSNTSTLPITQLAKASKRPRNFIGIHFFSPVDKMMLVEIIMGRRTSPKALAKALDYCRAIRKTPIVVNDSRGFYTSRVVGTYIREGHMMLAEGVPPAMVENLGRMAGMPVGPLALNDEVAVDLAWKILQATRKKIGDKAVNPRQEALLEEMVIKRGRLGRKNGKGFYDYPDKGKKHLWPDLHEILPDMVDPDMVDQDEIKQRLLVIQALETARCFQEGVLTDVREADVGSILGFGYAPYAGGTLSYIDGMGVAAFVDLCKKLARKHGPRFRPNKLLREMAENGEIFYGRFNPYAEKEAA